VLLEPAEAVLDGAAWRADGGSFQSSGAELGDLAPGYHAVDFLRPAGWSEPEAMEVVVSGGEANEVTARYVPLPAFYFESVPPQTARHGKPLRLIVHSIDPDDPASPTRGLRLAMSVDPLPAGPVTYDPASGELSYNPDAQDRTDFTVTFSAPAAGGPVTGSVLVSPLPDLAAEDSVIQFRDERIEPESDDYVSIREETSASQELFNLQQRNTRKVSVSGAWLLFEAGSTVMTLYDRYEGDEDVKELVIYADRVTIRSPLHLPETRVEIYARELRFEGSGSIDVTPMSEEARPALVTDPNDNQLIIGARDGVDGVRAPDMVVAVETFHADPSPARRFILHGGNGQPGGSGRNGRSVLRAGTRICELHFGNPVVVEICTNIETDVDTVLCGTTNVRCESAVRDGRPGEPGDGGSLFSTLNLSSHADLAGGAAGQRGEDRLGGRDAVAFGKFTGRVPPRGCTGAVFNRITPAPGADLAAPAPSRAIGAAGSLMRIGDPGRWLHPISFQSYLAFLKDLYLAGKPLETRRELVAYGERIRLLKGSLPEGEERMSFGQLESEIEALLFRIDSNLDYFGNPLTWVPMLSFEANLAAFTAELDRAIPVLYLAYWVEAAASDARNTQAAIAAAKERLGDEIDAALDQYEAALDQLPLLTSQAEEANRKIASLTVRLRELESALLRRAQENVEERHKVPFWKRAVGVMSAITKMIPVGQPALGFAGVGLGLIPTFDPDNPGATVERIPSLLEAVNNTDYTSCLGEQAADEDDDDDDRPSRTAQLKACGSLLVGGVKGIREALKESAVKADEVKAELEKLRANEPRLAAIAAEIDAFNKEKQLLIERIAFTAQILTSFSTLVTENDLATQKLDQNLDSVLDVLDHQALLYVRDMGQQTEDRLLKYQYFMAKAYQFRTLKPYTGSLQLGRLFTEVRDLVAGDSDHELTLADFEALKGIYLDELGRIASEIVTDLNLNAPARSSPVSFALSPDEIEELNETGAVAIDLARLDLFGANEEDLRIVDLRTADLDVRTTGQVGRVATLRLKFEHSGNSRVLSDGHGYLFTHYRAEGVNPIRWGTVYDGLTDRRTETTISAATESLLRVLLGLASADSDSVLLFSRPGALTEIVVTKEVNADNGVTIDVERLVLELVYDFSERSGRTRSVNIEVNDDLLPLITVSRRDADGRTDGRGRFRRSFASTEPVRLEAPPTHGVWTFERWEAVATGASGGGAAVETSRVIEIAPTQDVTIRAVYSAGIVPPPPVTAFRRGDANRDGAVNISDPSAMLVFLFLGGSPLGCADAGDANDDGRVDISDAVSILSFLFLGGERPPAPGATACGVDPTADALRCDAGGGCN
jgi:hypothetical protein